MHTCPPHSESYGQSSHWDRTTASLPNLLHVTALDSYLVHWLGSLCSPNQHALYLPNFLGLPFAHAPYPLSMYWHAITELELVVTSYRQNNIFGTPIIVSPNVAPHSSVVALHCDDCAKTGDGVISTERTNVLLLGRHRKRMPSRYTK